VFEILNKLKCGKQNEKGITFIVLLILYAFTAIIIVPLLSFTMTGLNTGRVFEEKTAEYYAADAGIRQAVWQTKYEHIWDFTDPEPYSPYDFDTTWPDSSMTRVNGKDVFVDIRNVWIPFDIPPPSAIQASALIEGVTGNPPRLFVTGRTLQTGITASDGSTTISQYQVEIEYYPDPGEDLYIETVSVWLPCGFAYFSDDVHKCTLENSGQPASSRIITDCAGNQAVSWDFGLDTPVSDFLGVATTDYPISLKAAFFYTPPQNQVNATPYALTWVTVHGVDLDGDGNSDSEFVWDANVQVYQIESRCGDTVIDAYVPKSFTRQLSSALSGDFAANGNALLVDNDRDSNNIKETHLTSSEAVINSIPQDADVQTAYLYWSGWKDEDAKTTLYSDPCSGFGSDWNPGDDWSVYSNSYFRGSAYDQVIGENLLSLHSSRDLSGYSSASHAVAVCWDQWVSYAGSTPGSGDGLDFAFSADGGFTWSSYIHAFRGNIRGDPQNFSYVIPVPYLTSDFRIRFSLVGFARSGQYCNIDNIKISDMKPWDKVQFKIDGTQCYFGSDGNPQQGNGDLIADSSQVIPNTINAPPSPTGTDAFGYSYACKIDVTALVRAYAWKPPSPATNCPGNARFTVGDTAHEVGDNTGHSVLAYAGWSIVIIYNSPSTMGHQLYLFDKFVFMEPTVHRGDLDIDGDGQPGGTLSGFIVPEPIPGETDAARISCFIGEGDECWAGDFLAFNAPTHYRTDIWPPSDPQQGIPDSYKLWDGTESMPKPASSGGSPSLPNSQYQPDNVCNGKFRDSSGEISDEINGVDIDTFTITWSSGMLNPGDTSANIDFCSNVERWNLVYIIFSFRSITSTGGLLNYIVR